MLAVYIALCVLFGSSGAVEVATSLGNIRGLVMKSRLGTDFFAFKAIRYANPPVGVLRFKSPQPVSPWKPKVFDATDDGPICPQSPFNASAYSEDCLRLNVYTKSLDEKALKPVMIYMHPGGFYAGSGKNDIFAGPQLLMDRDIVLVSINYRLGTLGFLATGTAEAPGNAGLKDQVVAFKWVRDHIIKFGGDPNSVTLFGYSAGSWSIGLHMASPMSKGLFHRGIAMSASAVSHTPYYSEQVDLAKKQARLVNCPENNVGAMVKCLRETRVEEFVRTQPAMFEFGYNPVLNWMPVIEKDLGQERFLIEDPTESFQTGRVQRIPLIVGMNKDEFVNIAHDVLQNQTQVRELNENWDTLAPILFQYERNTPKSREVSRVLRKEFLNNLQLDFKGNFDDLGKIFSDGLIKFGVHRFAHLAARYMPVYYYRFSYQGRYSFFYYPKDKPYGTVHHDDLIYLLYFPELAPLFKKTDPEDKTVERLTRMWTHFAKTSNPNKPNDEFIGNVSWQPLDLKKENYLDIGQELVPKEGLELERFRVWKNLFPLDWSGKPCKHHQESEDYPEPLEGRKH